MLSVEVCAIENPRRRTSLNDAGCDDDGDDSVLKVAVHKGTKKQ
jgi:hypothetical protein